MLHELSLRINNLLDIKHNWGETFSWYGVELCVLSIVLTFSVEYGILKSGRGIVHSPAILPISAFWLLFSCTSYAFYKKFTNPNNDGINYKRIKVFLSISCGWFFGFSLYYIVLEEVIKCMK